MGVQFRARQENDDLIVLYKAHTSCHGENGHVKCRLMKIISVVPVDPQVRVDLGT